MHFSELRGTGCEEDFVLVCWILSDLGVFMCLTLGFLVLWLLLPGAGVHCLTNGSSGYVEDFVDLGEM